MQTTSYSFTEHNGWDSCRTYRDATVAQWLQRCGYGLAGVWIDIEVYLRFRSQQALVTKSLENGKWHFGWLLLII